MRRYDAVTFDMGYTLVHFRPSEHELTLSAFHSLGLYPDPHTLHQVRDEVWGAYFAGARQATFEPSEERDLAVELELNRQMLARLGFDDPGLARPLWQAAKAAFSAPGAMCVYPEVHSVLRELRTQGYRLGIVSNWSWDLENYVRLAGLSEYLDVIIASARAGCEKPHPEIFRQALAALECRPERAIHVGDSHAADVVGARSGGMDALWLDREGKDGHADCRAIRDLSEVLAVLAGGQGWR